MQRTQFISPHRPQKNGEKDLFSSSFLFADTATKPASPNPTMNMSGISAPFSDSFSRYSSNRKPLDLFSPPPTERRPMPVEPLSATPSAARRGRPPVASVVLDDASSLTSSMQDLGARLKTRMAEDSEVSRLASSASAYPPTTPLAAPPQHRQDALWARWIVVIGTDASQSLTALIQRFQQHGAVAAHQAGPGNWLFLRYEAAAHAERAASSPLVHATPTLLLSVQQMSAQLARQMGVSLSGDGLVILGLHAHPVEGSSVSTSAGAEEAELRQRRAGRAPEEREIDESADLLYVRPRRRKNICERIMDFFWASS